MRSDDERLWAQLGEDDLVYDGFIKVLSRRLQLPDGRETSWDILGIPRTVAVLALTAEHEVVMVRQYRPAPGRLVVSLPGGLVDEDESVEEAALRELREETGYAAASLEVVAAVHPNNATNARYAAIARDCVPAGAQQLDDYEDCEVVVMTLPDVRRELRAGRLGAVEQTYLALDHAGLL